MCCYVLFGITCESIRCDLFCLLLLRRRPISTRTDTLFPYTTLVRSAIRDRISRLLHRDHPGTQVAQHLARTPWWVRAFTAARRPIVAVVVLVMCEIGRAHV